MRNQRCSCNGIIISSSSSSDLDGSGWMDLGWLWTDLDGYEWIWMDMDGYGWIWMDLDGSVCMSLSLYVLYMCLCVVNKCVCGGETVRGRVCARARVVVDISS